MNFITFSLLWKIYLKLFRSQHFFLPIVFLALHTQWIKFSFHFFNALPTACFGVIAFYFIISRNTKSIFLAGCFLCIMYMTRFDSVIFLLGAVLLMLLYTYKKVKSIYILLSGFTLALTFHVGLNLFFFKAPFYTDLEFAKYNFLKETVYKKYPFYWYVLNFAPLIGPSLSILFLENRKNFGEIIK